MKVCKMAAASKLLLIASVCFSASAFAAEQWSTDLWTEPSGQGGQAGSQSSDWSWWWGTGGAAGGSGSQQGSQPSTGLWSENLWSEPPAGGQPAEQPDQPIGNPTPVEGPLLPPEPVVDPEPIQDPPPMGEPQPAVDPQLGPNPDPANTIMMQIGNSKAIVRGKETMLSVPPFTINGRAMIPLRFIGEALNATVSWSEAEQKVTMELNGKKAELWVNQSRAMKDGQQVALDFPPMVLNGTTLVPLRFVGEFFGYRVNFDNAAQTITITGQGRTPEPEHPEQPQPEQPEQPEQPQPEQPQPEEPEQPQPPGPDELGFNYFGTWELRTDGVNRGMPMGKMVLNADGTYGISNATNGIVTGTWRPAEENEVIGIKNALILKDGPTGVDWVVIPKRDGIVSVRYHYGYTGATKIWFEYSLGFRLEN